MTENNMVDHPAHYTSGKVECIDAIEAATGGLTGIEAVCTGNAIKYGAGSLKVASKIWKKHVGILIK